MLRTQLTVALLLAATLVQAEDGMDKFLGEYTAKTVCDSHNEAPHVRKEGNFVIAGFVNAEGKDRAIIVGRPGFSSYDWSEVEFEYHPGREFRDIEISCPDVAGADIRADLATRRYIYDGRQLTVAEIAELSKFLEADAGERGREHLRAEYHFHEHRKCLRDENNKLESGCHVIKIYTCCDDRLFVEYQAVNDGIHAGHVHN